MTIQLYTAANCHRCTATKRRLDQRGHVYETVDLDANMEAREALRAEGHTSLPVVKVLSADGSVVDSWTGFNPGKVDRLSLLAA